MAFTRAEQNDYGFSELTSNDVQPVITNSSGGDYSYKEIVVEGGVFGEVMEPDGIPNGESGRINIENRRTVRTSQIETTDTFTVGIDLWLDSGFLRDSDQGGSTKVGVVVGFGGTAGAHTYVDFRPLAQFTS